MNKFAQLLLLILCCSCSNLQMQLDNTKYYPKDMEIDVDGHKATGAIVVPQRDQYAIAVTAKGKLDLLWYSTCHRSEYKEQAWHKGIFKSKYEARFSYRPNGGMEHQNCQMHITGMEKIKGRHSWGLIDFEDDTATLPALVKCNGSEYNSRGVTVCQSQAGLLQEIEFANEAQSVKPKADHCHKLEQLSKGVYRYKLPKGNCVYIFKSGDQYHRLTTYGWEEPILRED